MKKQFTVKLGDFAPAQSTRTLTPEGFLLCAGAKMAKAPQVRQYYAAEFGGVEGYSANQVINVLTSAETLFGASTIASFQGVDATTSHPPGNSVNAATWNDFVAGTVRNVRQDGEFLLGDILIKDRELIQQVQQNQQVEISLGYSADLVLQSGALADGTPYQAEFTNIQGDHVALVYAGRCGGDCRIGDQNNFKPQHNPTSEQTMKIVVDGLPFEVAENPALAAALDKLNQKVSAADAIKLKVGDKDFTVASEHAAVQALIDKLVGDNAANLEKIQTLEANQVTPEKLQHMADERAQVIGDAKKLNPSVKTDGCSCEQIKREAISAKAGDAVLSAILGGIAIGDAKPEQVDVAFRALTATAQATPPANHLSGALQGNIGDAAAISNSHNNQNQAQSYDKSAAWKMK